MQLELCGTDKLGMLCKSNPDVEKEMLNLREKGILLYTLEMWVEGNSEEESNWESYVTVESVKRGLVMWAGNHSKDFSPVKWFSSDPKETDQTVEKVAIQVSQTFLPKPHYNSVPSEMLYGYYSLGTLNWFYLLLQVSFASELWRKEAQMDCLLSVKSKSQLYLQKSSNFGFCWVHYV